MNSGSKSNSTNVYKLELTFLSYKIKIEFTLIRYYSLRII